MDQDLKLAPKAMYQRLARAAKTRKVDEVESLLQRYKFQPLLLERQFTFLDLLINADIDYVHWRTWFDKNVQIIAMFLAAGLWPSAPDISERLKRLRALAHDRFDALNRPDLRQSFDMGLAAYALAWELNNG